MRKVISLMLIALMLCLPIAGQTTDACEQAKRDAQENINGNLWFGAGCLLGVIGWGAAYVIKPEPKASTIVGKDAEWVAQYTDCYREAGKEIQTKKSLNGCMTYAAVYLVFNLLVLSSM